MTRAFECVFLLQDLTNKVRYIKSILLNISLIIREYNYI